MKTVEPVSVEGRIKIPYRWPAGKLGTHFLAALRDEGKILAVSCAACGQTHVPPRPACLTCGAPLTEWAPGATKGTLEAWTRREDALYGAVCLDGADTPILHRLVDSVPSSLRVGQRVEVVFADQRQGSILDIRGFRPIGESGPPAYAPPHPRSESAFLRFVERSMPRIHAAPRFRPVAVLGVAQTHHASRREDSSYAELVFGAVQALLARTGMTHNQIETVVTASSDFWDGRTISDMAVQDAVGAAGKSASKVSMDGVFALAYGAARVNSGAYKTCLVVAHGKASEGDPRKISTAAFDPVFERPLGLDDHAALGLEASEWTLENITLAELAQAAAESWNKAARNPNAHRQTTRTAAMVLDSSRVADPLHADMIAPDSDGACAVLLADEEMGRRLGATVWLEGFACATRVYPLGSGGLRAGLALSAVAEQAGMTAGIPQEVLGDTDFLHPSPMSDVAKRTRELAGRFAIADAIDVAEVHDASSLQTILWRRALGLRDGALYNPSGGAMGAQPGFATGLVRVAEVYERLARGEGKVGLAHGQTGFVGQAHGVWILRRR